MNIFRDHGEATPVGFELFADTADGDVPATSMSKADPRDLAELAAELRDARRMLTLAALG